MKRSEHQNKENQEGNNSGTYPEPQASQGHSSEHQPFSYQTEDDEIEVLVKKISQITTTKEGIMPILELEFLAMEEVDKRLEDKYIDMLTKLINKEYTQITPWSQHGATNHAHRITKSEIQTEVTKQTLDAIYAMAIKVIMLYQDFRLPAEILPSIIFSYQRLQLNYFGEIMTPIPTDTKLILAKDVAEGKTPFNVKNFVDGLYTLNAHSLNHMFQPGLIEYVEERMNNPMHYLAKWKYDPSKMTLEDYRRIINGMGSVQIPLQTGAEFFGFTDSNMEEGVPIEYAITNHNHEFINFIKEFENIENATPLESKSELMSYTQLAIRSKNKEAFHAFLELPNINVNQTSYIKERNRPESLLTTTIIEMPQDAPSIIKKIIQLGGKFQNKDEKLDAIKHGLKMAEEDNTALLDVLLDEVLMGNSIADNIAKIISNKQGLHVMEKESKNKKDLEMNRNKPAITPLFTEVDLNDIEVEIVDKIPKDRKIRKYLLEKIGRYRTFLQSYSDLLQSSKGNPESRIKNRIMLTSSIHGAKQLNIESVPEQNIKSSIFEQAPTRYLVQKKEGIATHLENNKLEVEHFDAGLEEQMRTRHLAEKRARIAPYFQKNELEVEHLGTKSRESQKNQAHQIPEQNLEQDISSGRQEGVQRYYQESDNSNATGFSMPANVERTERGRVKTLTEKYKDRRKSSRDKSPSL